MKKPEKCLKRLLPLMLVILVLLSSCGSQPEAVVTPTPTISATDTPAAGTDVDQAILDATGLDLVPTLAGIAPTRTPEPTATPDALTREITQIVQDTGLSGKTFFWLGIVDWINLGISLFIVLVSYLLGTWVIRWLLPRLVSRTKTKLDDRLLQVAGAQMRWLVVLVILRFAVKRLSFGYPAIKTFITDICYFLIIFIIAWLLWRLINLVAQQADARARKSGHQKEAESLITLMVWGLRFLVLILVLMMILIHFGINVTGFAFILGVIALALSLAGRDILTDIISGAMILIDQPYRIGDRLDLPSLDSWGDVVDIGMRSTKILSVENRMVVIPNSQIGKRQVVNYSYPDPSYYDTTDIGVAFDNDVEQVEQLLKNAAGSVDGVHKERGIDSRLESFTRDEMIFRVGWWMKDNDDYYKLRQLVNRAIVKKFKEAGVIFPYQKEQVEMDTDSNKSEIPGKSNQDQ